MITSDMLGKIAEIARLHDEAFWHLHQYDGHAKSSDGSISIEIGFGTVWTRKEQEKTQPSIGVAIYSYVVASNTPSYPNFGERNHWFKTVDEALMVMKEWHAKAMQYNPSPEYLDEMDVYATELWDSIKDRMTVIEVDPKND